MEYLVTWRMTVEADDPYDAAWQAFDAVRCPGTTATMYEVQTTDSKGQPTGEPVELDLMEEEQEGAPTTLTIRREANGDTYTRI